MNNYSRIRFVYASDGRQAYDFLLPYLKEVVQNNFSEVVFNTDHFDEIANKELILVLLTPKLPLEMAAVYDPLVNLAWQSDSHIITVCIEKPEDGVPLQLRSFTEIYPDVRSDKGFLEDFQTEGAFAVGLDQRLKGLLGDPGYKGPIKPKLGQKQDFSNKDWADNLNVDDLK